MTLFPNVLLGVHSDHYYVIVLTPEAPDLTIETLHIYYRPPADSDETFAETRRVTLERWREVFVEDVDLVERLQLGRRSPAFGGGCFSPVMDAPTHAFHQLIANHLA